jgi:omega-6 fatty acid desaturase (delta-12 desaturase)
VNSAIPHYNAWRGSALLKRHFPDLVRYDATPIHRALWRVATRCSVVRQEAGEGFFYEPQLTAPCTRREQSV